MTRWIGPVIALLLSLLFRVHRNYEPLDAYWVNQINSTVEKHFSENYYEARSRFREQIEALNGTHRSVGIDVPHMDLTIDFGIFYGSKARAIVHISGTHGVEGFAGSAIQLAVLDKLAQQKERMMTQADDRPTVIFVHALNPFGFAKLRRTNPNNVDLNRNFLSAEEFAERVTGDPNQFGYRDVLNVLEPRDPLDWRDSFWLKISPWEFLSGLPRVKRAGVCGNYHSPKGLFYGGSKLQSELIHLRQVLSETLDLKALKSFGMIDVHTGLGPPGYDTFILTSDELLDEVKTLFQGDQDENRVVALGSSGGAKNEVLRGYDRASGLLCSGIGKLLPSHVKNLCVAQEFGTVPFILGIKALIEENAMYFNNPHRRIPYADALRDCNMLHRSASWKNEIINRGTDAFFQLWEHV